MTISPKIVILGGAGMLGHKMFQHLRLRFPGTVCTMRCNPGDLPYRRIEMFQSADVIAGIDAFDFNSLSQELLRYRPQFVINCIGVIKQRHDASSYIPTITLNALLPHRLAELSAGWGGHLIHFSTDCVFSGHRGMYKEEDASDAEDLYGRTKYLGETQETNALTLRTSIIGRELSSHRSLLDWFLAQKGGRVSGYRKAIYSGVTTNHLAEVVAGILLRYPSLQGVYQVATEPISKYELLCALREAYGLDVGVDPIDGEVADRSMDGSRFREATGYIPPSWTLLAQQLAKDTTPYEQWLRQED